MAVAAVTKSAFRKYFALLLLCNSAALFAAVLPEERVDALYHRYDGGGLKVDGTSVLVRKNIADKVSISGNYFVDNVSSASIDVVTQASKFTDKRTEKSLNVDYLFDRTLLSGGYINSTESDYLSKTFHFDMSQDFFGDLTTFSMGYTRGNNTIKDNNDASIHETSVHQEYRTGLSQILTRNLIVSGTEEIMVDDGYLSNPYRSYRFLDPSVARGYSYEREVFPKARTSSTTALHARYHLPNYRAAIYGDYRYYTDGWDIKSNTIEVGYDHTLPAGWLFDVHVRYYKQSAANFYSDLFARRNEDRYMTRDKQLSDMHSITYGAGITYDLPYKSAYIDKLTFNLFWDHVQFYFDDFRNVQVQGMAPGTEPEYSYDADILRFLFTVWF
ncbi:MAG TPA: DUF3570 domain-containing protein [Spongiibacteraceae bacterium]